MKILGKLGDYSSLLVKDLLNYWSLVWGLATLALNWIFPRMGITSHTQLLSVLIFIVGAQFIHGLRFYALEYAPLRSKIEGLARRSPQLMVRLVTASDQGRLPRIEFGWPQDLPDKGALAAKIKQEMAKKYDLAEHEEANKNPFQVDHSYLRDREDFDREVEEYIDGVYSYRTEIRDISLGKGASFLLVPILENSGQVAARDVRVEFKLPDGLRLSNDREVLAATGEDTKPSYDPPRPPLARRFLLGFTIPGNLSRPHEYDYHPEPQKESSAVSMRFIGTDKIRYDFPIVNPGHQDTAIPGFWVTLSGNPTGEMVQWHIDVAISSSDLETPRQSTITILGHRVSSRVAELTPL